MSQPLSRISDAILWRHLDSQQLHSANHRRNVANVADAVALIRPFFHNHRRERLCTILLNRWNEVMAILVAEGEKTRVVVSPRKLVGTALQLEAASVILAHNHPSGDSSPSRADISVTRHLANVLRSLDIALLDHIIFGHRGFTSFRQERML